MKDTNDLSESRQIISRLLDENIQALESIAKSYAWQIGKPRSATQLEEMVNEIVQNVAVVALQKADQYDTNREFLPWLRSIARFEALAFVRERTRANQRIISISELPKVANHTETLSEAEMFDLIHEPSQIHQEGEDIEAIEAILNLLDVSDRQIVEMVYMSGFSAKKVAEELGMTEGAVYTKLHRIRNKMKSLMTSEDNS